MSDLQCGTVRELIPDFVGNRLGPDELEDVDAHVTACVQCRAELELVQALLASRPAAPRGLEDRVIAALRAGRAGGHRPWWGLTAAAVAALALGIGITSEPAEAPDVPGYAYEVEEGTMWSSDDGLVAGAPSLDMLTDEGLELLLEELSVGASGGAA